MEVGVVNIEVLNQPLICGDFDSKLEHFKWRMMVHIVGILMPFLAFQWFTIILRPTSVSGHVWHFLQEHEMYPRLCGQFNYCWNCCGIQCWNHGPLLLQLYNHLTHVQELVKLIAIEDNDYFFGQVVFINDVNCNHFNFEKWNTWNDYLCN
jgi:hypothetical protein